MSQLITSVPVVVKVDAHFKRRYADAMKRLAECEAEGAAAWHRKYLVVADIIEHLPPLYLAGGFATGGEFMRTELEETQQAVIRNIRIAKLSTVEEITTFGITKVRLAMAFVEAKTKTPIRDRSAIDFGKLRIQFTKGGKAISKALADISRSDLEEAIAQVTGRASKPRQESPTAKAFSDAIKRSGVKEVRATVTKSKFVLRGPLSGLAALVRELMKLDIS